MPCLPRLFLSVLFLLGGGSPGQAVDYDTGTLEGAVLWNGSPLEARLASASCGFGVQAAQGSQTSTTAITTSGAYSFPALQGGTYSLSMVSSQNGLLANGPQPNVPKNTCQARADLANRLRTM